jgi:hypothetical protein
MTANRGKESSVDKTIRNTNSTRTTSTAPFIAPAVLGIMMMISSVFLGGGPLSAYAAASTETQSFSIPVDFTHTAADSGCSEDIHLTGQLHIVTHTTENNKGVVIVKTHFNPQGVTGEGIDPVTQEPTGTTYQGTGVTSSIFTFKPGAAQTQTDIINFNLIGHGSKPDTDSIHHLNAHLTVNADGTATAEVFNEINDCR